MIYLFTGVPGAGKTLNAVRWLDSLYSDMQEKGEFRPVYANIDGLKIPHLPSPDDWTRCPDNSVIIYDEAQSMFPNQGKTGNSSDHRVTELETHRHRGIDIVLITQDPTLLHPHVRKLVGEHQHIKRVSGVKGGTVLIWPQAVYNPDDYHRGKEADSKVFKHDKRLYGLYKSAVAHTDKFRIPMKFKFLLVCLTVLLSGVAYGVVQSFQNWNTLAGNVPDPSPADVSVIEAEPEPVVESDYRLVGALSQSGNSETTISVWDGERYLTFVGMCSGGPYLRDLVCYYNGHRITTRTGSDPGQNSAFVEGTLLYALQQGNDASIK